MTDGRAHVLIVVESRHGATREISGVLAQRLVTHGASVTVVAPEDCDEIDADVDAVVIGSGVYYGKWLKSAQRFVEAHSTALAARPVWLFSSGPLGDEADIECVDAGIEPDVVAHLIEVTGARAHHVFAGRLDRHALRPLEKLVATGVHAPEGDFRDWDDVASWADAIASEVCPHE
jgi:menaquinone-dependent protoporphyrinogen oxidase